jgi:hypothetical protein
LISVWLHVDYGLRLCRLALLSLILVRLYTEAVGVQRLECLHRGEKFDGVRTRPRLCSWTLSVSGCTREFANLALNCFVLSFQWHEGRRARCGVSDSEIDRGVPGDDDDVKSGGLREAITR